MHRVKKFLKTNGNYMAALGVFYCIMCIIGVLITTMNRYPQQVDIAAYLNIETAERIFVDGVEEASSVKLPYNVKNKASKELDIYIKIPKNSYDVSAISFIASQKNVWIYHGVKEIYSHVYQAVPNTKSTGSGRVFCPLIGVKQGEIIRIRLQRINEIQFNAIDNVTLKSAIMTENTHIPKNNFVFAIALGLFSAGILLLIASIVYTSFGASIAALIHLAIFIISYAGWTICSSKMAQVFTSNWELTHAIEYMCLYAMPISLWGFLEYNWNFQSKFIKIMMYIMLGLFSLTMTLRLIGLLEFYEILSFYHFIIISTFLFVILAALKNFSQKPFSLKLFYIAFLILVSMGANEVIKFYRSPPYDALENQLIFALAGMVIIMVVSYISSSKESLQKFFEDRIYKELAYKDALTELGNRARFERDIEILEGKKQSLENLIFVIADANYLKNINDTMGHLVGDKAIRAMADAIKTAFSDMEEIYRIGGDEFCIIIQNESIENVRTKLEQVDELLLCSEIGFPISLSYGFEEYNCECHDSLIKLYKAADDKMYETKSFYRKISDI